MASSQDPLNLTVEANGDTVLARVVGEIDASTSDDLGRVLGDALVPQIRTLVLDVAGVEFIDSSGLRALVQTHRVMAERDGSFVLRGPGDTFRRLLDVTGLTDMFTIE